MCSGWPPTAGLGFMLAIKRARRRLWMGISIRTLANKLLVPNDTSDRGSAAVFLCVLALPCFARVNNLPTLILRSASARVDLDRVATPFLLLTYFNLRPPVSHSRLVNCYPSCRRLNYCCAQAGGCRSFLVCHLRCCSRTKVRPASPPPRSDNLHLITAHLIIAKTRRISAFRGLTKATARWEFAACPHFRPHMQYQ